MFWHHCFIATSKIETVLMSSLKKQTNKKIVTANRVAKWQHLENTLKNTNSLVT